MKNVFLLLTFVWLSTSTVLAQDITVEKLIANYLENIGGAEKWKAVKSTRMTGVTNVQGMQLPTKVIAMYPNLTKVEIDVQGNKIVPQAFDGEAGWSLNPFAGATEPTKSTEEESGEMAKQNFEDELIDYVAKGNQVVLLGNKEIDGSTTYEVKLTKKSGDEIYYYFDTENFVPIMRKDFINVGPAKGTAIETYISDYQEVEGLMMSMSIEQKVNGQTIMQMTMEKVEINPTDLNKEAFAFPKK
jgi:hypothetical protein